MAGDAAELLPHEPIASVQRGRLVTIAVDLTDEQATRRELRAAVAAAAPGGALDACICVAGGDTRSAGELPPPAQTSAALYASYWRTNFLTASNTLCAVMEAVRHWIESLKLDS